MKVGDHSKWVGAKLPLLTKEERKVLKERHKSAVDDAENCLKSYIETNDGFYKTLYTLAMLHAELNFEVGRFEPDPRYVEMNKE